MSWRKYFTINDSSPAFGAQMKAVGPTTTSTKYSSYLPEVYAGHPNRIQRYHQYDDMDRDSDICAALDTIADFCTQSEEQSDSPFEIKELAGNLTETEVKLLKKELAKWTQMNGFRKRLWYMFRNTIKNGDSFFLRDPETREWLWLDHYAVEMVQVDEERGKQPKNYFVRGFDLVDPAKFGATSADMSKYRSNNGTISVTQSRTPGTQSNGFGSLPGSNRDPRNMRQQGSNELFAIEAKHVVHLSLSVGMDINWPFGASLLESVFKTYKQKELLEDAIIIYRVQRAPERRVFYIDTGHMPEHKRREHLEQIKNEINQRRIPNSAGGGMTMIDASYNPLSINEDFYFAQGAEGRGSRVETLPGGDSLGEIGDLSEFTKKLARGLRIPSSYLPLSDDQGTSYNDGKLGAALIQEYRFNKYCMRLQSLLSPIYDAEFKDFLEHHDVSIDSTLFEIRFNPPQNFTKYRQIEIDQAQANVYSQVSGVKALAERYKLKRYLAMSDIDILENERMWAEENASKIKNTVGSSPAETDSQVDLSGVGARPPGDDFGDMGGDDMDLEFGSEPEGEGGDEGGAPPAPPPT